LSRCGEIPDFCSRFLWGGRRAHNRARDGRRTAGPAPIDCGVLLLLINRPGPGHVPSVRRDARHRSRRPGYRPSYRPGRPSKGERKRAKSHPATDPAELSFFVQRPLSKAVFGSTLPLRTVASAAPPSSPPRGRGSASQGASRPAAESDRTAQRLCPLRHGPRGSGAGCFRQFALGG